LFEVDEAASRIREEADQDANIIIGASFDESLEGIVRVSVVATGIDNPDSAPQTQRAESLLTELAGKLRNVSRHVVGRIERNAPPPQSESPPALPATLHPEGRSANPNLEHARHAAPQGLDPYDAAPMESDAREALQLFERARAVAERAHYEFAAWYVAGNIERLEILLGHADRAVGAIRRRLRVLQTRGAKYDEIVTRSNLAWGLRTLGRYQEALHELDAALSLARETGTLNVLLEFIEYDRSIHRVVHPLGDIGHQQRGNIDTDKVGDLQSYGVQFGAKLLRPMAIAEP